MWGILLTSLLAVLRRILTALVGEDIVQWVIFKVAHWAARLTKTKVDDEFVDELEEAVEKQGGPS